MNINYTDIGKRIRQERCNRNFTQEKLAETIGISVTHMSNIENANTKLSLPVLIDIANVLGCDSDVLLCGSLINNENSSVRIISELLSDCTKDERLIIIDTIQTLKNALKDNIRKE